MNARRAARELALLTLFQIDKQGTGAPDQAAISAVLQRESLQELMLSSVRALSGEAEFQVKSAADWLADVSRSMQEYELEHPTNLETPLDAKAKPVPVPTTREMVEKIEQCLQGAEYLFEALRIPELISHIRADEVQAYATKLLRLVAAAEMTYEPNVDLSVSINEAVELAKQFGNEDSYKFINGVLGSLAQVASQETGKALTGVYHA